MVGRRSKWPVVWAAILCWYDHSFPKAAARPLDFHDICSGHFRAPWLGQAVMPFNSSGDVHAESMIRLCAADRAQQDCHGLLWQAGEGVTVSCPDRMTPVSRSRPSSLLLVCVNVAQALKGPPRPANPKPPRPLLSGPRGCLVGSPSLGVLDISRLGPNLLPISSGSKI